MSLKLQSNRFLTVQPLTNRRRCHISHDQRLVHYTIACVRLSWPQVLAHSAFHHALLHVGHCDWHRAYWTVTCSILAQVRVLSTLLNTISSGSTGSSALALSLWVFPSAACTYPPSSLCCRWLDAAAMRTISLHTALYQASFKALFISGALAAKCF